MKKWIKIILIAGIAVFAVLQFFQPELNKGEITETHIFKNEQIPADVQEILTNACMDCHSNNTNYPWYDRISPVSWMVSKHVVDGKDELNFSEWGEQDAYDKIGSLEDIYEEVERKTMPIKAYSAMHPTARLTDEQRQALCNWTKKLSGELSAKLSEQ